MIVYSVLVIVATLIGTAVSILPQNLPNLDSDLYI